jgi:predicted transcriptional regulator
MTALEQYNTKHQEVIVKLNQLSASKIEEGKILIVCKNVGEALNKSTQTIYNYLSGRIKDGYLAEAICQELKKLKTIKQTFGKTGIQ